MDSLKYHPRVALTRIQPTDKKSLRSRAPSPDRSSDVNWEVPSDISIATSESSEESRSISESEVVDILAVCTPSADCDTYYLRSKFSYRNKKNNSKQFGSPGSKLSSSSVTLGSADSTHSQSEPGSLTEFVDDSFQADFHLPLVMHNVALYPRVKEDKLLKKMYFFDTNENHECRCLFPGSVEDYALFYFEHDLCPSRLPLHFISSGPKMIITDPENMKYFEQNPELGRFLCDIDQLVKLYSRTTALCIAQLKSHINQSQQICFSLSVKVDLTLKTKQYASSFQIDVTDKALNYRIFSDYYSIIQGDLKAFDAD